MFFYNGRLNFESLGFGHTPNTWKERIRNLKLNCTLNISTPEQTMTTHQNCINSTTAVCSLISGFAPTV